MRFWVGFRGLRFRVEGLGLRVGDLRGMVWRWGSELRAAKYGIGVEDTGGASQGSPQTLNLKP